MEALDGNRVFEMTYRRIKAGKSFYVRMKVSRMEDDEHFIIVGITNVDAEMRDAMAKSEALAEALTLAQKAGVTRQTIGLIESGEFNPSIKLCIAICKALGVTLNDIFWEDG